jgi:hypothetical protein
MPCSSRLAGLFVVIELAVTVFEAVVFVNNSLAMIAERIVVCDNRNRNRACHAEMQGCQVNFARYDEWGHVKSTE